MLMLRLVEFLFLAFLLYILFSQVIFPAITGTRLFPMLRTTDLHTKAVELREEVHDLEDVAEHLAIIADLTKKKAEIEARLAEIEAKKSASATTPTTKE